MLAGCLHKFCRDVQPRTALNGGDIVKTFTHRDHHVAFADVEIQRLVEAAPGMLQQYIFARDTQICGPILHIGGHIGGSYDHQPYVGTVGGDNELSRFLRVVQRHDACCGQQRQRIVEDATLR